jgi:biotin synthase
MLDAQTVEKPLTLVKSKANLRKEVDASGEWTVAQIEALFDLPFSELMHQAQETHKANFPEGDVELATLLSIKTGGCPEDCGYCPQAARYDTDVKAEKLMGLEEVLEAAKAAKAAGSNRFCMGAAWREPKDRDIEKVTAMIKGVKALGLETCATLGMLEASQAQALQEAGLDFYTTI